MKRTLAIVAVVLFALPLLAQKPTEMHLLPGLGGSLNLTNGPLTRLGRFHVSSTLPVIVFFSTPDKVREIHTSDSIEKLGSCATVNIREADVWCTDKANDHLYIFDTRDRHSRTGAVNIVKITMTGYGAPKS